MNLELEEFFAWIAEIDLREWQETMERELEGMENEANGNSL